MKEYIFDEFSILANEMSKEKNDPPFGPEDAGRALRFHRSLPDYRETELVSLKAAADRFQVDSIFVKDESSRFGLKAFKGLGGSYCIFRILCEKLGFDPDTADYTAFLEEDVRKRCGEIDFVTATDGNHGKGISWAAKLFGCRAHVYMPKGSVEARRRAIEEAGTAEAAITEYNYDGTIAFAEKLAEENGWILVQDTSWDGYETYPKWIIEGYLTLAAEAEQQMGEKRPTHIFLQAGVGAMAGGIESYFLRSAGEEKPVVTIVEPEEAACIYQSVRAEDGSAHTIPGNPETIMAGLNCGTPCGVTWPTIRDHSAFFVSCRDSVTEQGMRAYASPEGEDPAVVSGESGAVTYGVLRKILRSQKLRELFGITESSVILLVSTEGDTDPDGYREILALLQ